MFDFRDFNKMLNKPKVIQKNFKLLQKMLNNPNKKVTILTQENLLPIRKFFKDQFGMEVYVVLGSNNPKDKSDWIEKHIKKGYTDIAFMDDSSKNIRSHCADKLKSKYPDVRIKTHLVREHIDEEVQKYVNKLIH